jgi:hypothetical protein
MDLEETMRYVCTNCGKDVEEIVAHPEDEDPLVVNLREKAPDLFPAPIGPRQLFHTIRGFYYCYDTRMPCQSECGPLREWNEGDDYVAWACS